MALLKKGLQFIPPILLFVSIHLPLLADTPAPAEIVLPDQFTEPIDLSSGLLFRPDDRQEYANPDHDDSDWDVVREFPHNWKDHYDPDLRVGWYRVDVYVPNEPLDRALALRIYELNDTDETYWNGVRIGGSGTIDPERELPRIQAYAKDRIYEIPPDLVRTGEPNLLAIRVQQSSYYRAGFATLNSTLVIGPLEALQKAYYLSAFAELLPATMIFMVGLVFLVFFAYRPSTFENLFFGITCLLFGFYFAVRTQFAFLITEDLLELKRIEYVALFFMIFVLLDFFYFILRDRERDPKWLRWTVLALNAIPFLSLPVLFFIDDLRTWYEFNIQVAQPSWLLPLGLTVWIVIRALRAGSRDAAYLAIGLAAGLVCILHDVAVSRLWLPYVWRIGTYGFLLFLVVMALIIGARFLRMHQEMDRQRRELARLDELKDRFLSNMSHELNHPIASILLNAEMLKAGDYSSEDLPDSYDQLYTDGIQLQGLVQKMTIASRLESNEIKARPEYVKIERVVNEAVDQLRDLFGPDGDWKIATEIGPVELNTDPVLLRTVLYEILKNARQYGNGKENSQVSISAKAQGNEIHITLRDNGDGVRPADLERIKRKFIRVDDSLTYRESGTGLGLYIADRLTGILGGRLSIENETSGGLRVSVELPMGTQ